MPFSHVPAIQFVSLAASVIPVFSVVPQSLLKAVRAIAVVAFGFALASPAGAAGKAPSREMVFSIVRASSPICEPDCPEWIAADGTIADKTAKAFKAILKKAGDRRLPLLINSYGGRVDVAMTMGGLIREREMTVEIARTDYFLCEPWDNECKPDFKDGTFYGHANTTFGVCNSACPLLLAGGVRRIASPLSRVGVHQIVSTRENYRDRYKVYKEKLNDGKIVTKRKLVERTRTGTTRSTKLSRSLHRDLVSYLTGMDIKPTLISLMLSTPPEDIRYLNMEELKALGVATEIRELESLVGHRICKSRRRPENCTVRE